MHGTRVTSGLVARMDTATTRAVTVVGSTGAGAGGHARPGVARSRRGDAGAAVLRADRRAAACLSTAVRARPARRPRPCC
jgi:hypothetical protein